LLGLCPNNPRGDNPLDPYGTLMQGLISLKLCKPVESAPWKRHSRPLTPSHPLLQRPIYTKKPTLSSRLSLICMFYFSSYNLPFNFFKYCFVSLATTPLRAKSAIMFGNAMHPLKMSAIVQTALTVMYGPMNTATI